MLQKGVNKYKIRDYLITTGNLNACVGNLPVPNAVSIFRQSVMNENGKELGDFATFNELKLINPFAEKKKFINVRVFGVEEEQYY